MKTELKQLLARAGFKRQHGSLHSVSGVVCAEDGEHIGQFTTRSTSYPSNCWEGPARAAFAAHAVNVFQELVEALEAIMAESDGGWRAMSPLAAKAMLALQRANTITSLSSPSEENKTSYRGSGGAE